MANEKVLLLDPKRLSEKAYRLQIQKKGFLINENTTREMFEEQLQNIYLVYETADGIVGHLRIEKAIEILPTRKSLVLNEEIYDHFVQGDGNFLGRIAVHPDHPHKGIGTQLYQEAEKQLRAKNIEYLFSFVVLSPITNLGSILFHEKNDFERVDIAYPFSFSGIEKYQSFVYGKKLSS